MTKATMTSELTCWQWNRPDFTAWRHRYKIQHLLSLLCSQNHHHHHWNF